MVVDSTVIMLYNVGMTNTTETITAEIGTTGIYKTFTLTGDPALDVAGAVVEEHWCSDSSCDIAAARKAGCPFSAAHLLNGATETPLLDAVMAHYGTAAVGTDLYTCPDWDEWLAWHNEHGVNCPACGGYTYGDPSWRPERCGNCGYQLNTEEEPDGGE